MVERGGLENRCTRESTVGSNPTPSANINDLAVISRCVSVTNRCFCAGYCAGTKFRLALLDGRQEVQIHLRRLDRRVSELFLQVVNVAASAQIIDREPMTEIVEPERPVDQLALDRAPHRRRELVGDPAIALALVVPEHPP